MAELRRRDVGPVALRALSLGEGAPCGRADCWDVGCWDAGAWLAAFGAPACAAVPVGDVVCESGSCMVRALRIGFFLWEGGVFSKKRFGKGNGFPRRVFEARVMGLYLISLPLCTVRLGGGGGDWLCCVVQAACGLAKGDCGLGVVSGLAKGEL